MNLSDIQLLYDYNDWANRRILARSAQVTPEQFTVPTSHSWGSLHGTLVHTLDTEYGWRVLLQSSAWTADLKPEAVPTIDAIRTRWDEEDAAWRAYLASLTDDTLSGVLRYEIPEGVRERVVWHCIWHVINHGMQHRAEAAHMLTGYGHSPGELDFTQYMNIRNGVQTE
jgi:uncharacterized damage-inducible protein DinB